MSKAGDVIKKLEGLAPGQTEIKGKPLGDLKSLELGTEVIFKQGDELAGNVGKIHDIDMKNNHVIVSVGTTKYHGTDPARLLVLP